MRNKARSIPRLSSRQLQEWIVFSFLPLFVFFLSACDDITPVEYAAFENFPPSGIPPLWTGEFRPIPRDSDDISSARYDLVMTVRYNSRCRSRCLVIDAEEISLENMEPLDSRHQIELFDINGNPAGTGNLGLYEVSDTLHSAWRLPEGYSISLSTPLSPEDTEGINAIGIRLVRAGRASLFSIPAIGI